MDTILIIIGIIALITGFIGCIAPVIPGPPIAYIGLIMLQCTEKHPFSTGLMVIMCIVVVAVTVLDYLIPAMGTKKFGGSKYGSWGCLLGTFAGLFLMPWGIIVMPFAGAFIGEMIYNKETDQALKAATGAFLGFLSGVLCKIMVCVAIMVAFIGGLF